MQWPTLTQLDLQPTVTLAYPVLRLAPPPTCDQLIKPESDTTPSYCAKIGAVLSAIFAWRLWFGMWDMWFEWERKWVALGIGTELELLRGSLREEEYKNPLLQNCSSLHKLWCLGARRDGWSEDSYGHMDTSGWFSTGSCQRHWSSTQTTSGKISVWAPSKQNTTTVWL